MAGAGTRKPTSKRPAAGALDLDLLVQVPLANEYGVVFADVVYPLPITVDLTGTGDAPTKQQVVEVPLEILVGSELLPLDLELPLDDLLEASLDGHLLVRTVPVHVEPIGTPDRLTLATTEAPPLVPRAPLPIRPRVPIRPRAPIRPRTPMGH